MFFYKFTAEARRVLSRANQVAHSRCHARIGTVHILQGLAEEESGKAFQAFRNLKISTENIMPAIDEVVKTAGVAPTSNKLNLPQTRNARKVIKNAIVESRKYKAKTVGTEHILFGLLNMPDSSAVKVLEAMGFTSDQVWQEVITLQANTNK